MKDILTNETRRISGAENGFQTFTTNPQKKQIFLVEFGEKPVIKCYSEMLRLEGTMQSSQ